MVVLQRIAVTAFYGTISGYAFGCGYWFTAGAFLGLWMITARMWVGDDCL